MFLRKSKSRERQNKRTKGIKNTRLTRPVRSQHLSELSNSDKPTLLHPLLPCFCSFGRELQDGGHAREHLKWKRLWKKKDRNKKKKKAEGGRIGGGRKEVDGHGDSDVLRLKCSESADTPSPPPTLQPHIHATLTAKVSPQSPKRRYSDF
jgi:hypothetical protein